jgi:hypothetical protein
LYFLDARKEIIELTFGGPISVFAGTSTRKKAVGDIS